MLTVRNIDLIIAVIWFIAGVESREISLVLVVVVVVGLRMRVAGRYELRCLG